MNTHDDELNGLIYDEACRLTGLCCLMLASNGEEESGSQLEYKQRRLLDACFEETDEVNLSLILAIEQLQRQIGGGPGQSLLTEDCIKY